jgi:hypothetical protein
LSNFHGEPTHILKNQFLSLEYLDGAPRIVRFGPKGGPNLLADLDETVPTPYGDFRFRGGHRLWHSPESLPRTYIPDAGGALVSELENGVRIEQLVEPGTAISKCLEIRLNPDRAAIHLRHELRNDGLWSVELAPWALTMFRLGGVGIFPQPGGDSDPASLLPNRQITLWQYTRVSDPRLSLGDDFILVHATPDLPPLKFGYFNPHGWQAYWLDGVLFVKRYDPCAGAVFPDGGCNTETFCNNRFIELESLGPTVHLQPGGGVVHNETWELYESVNQSFIPASLKERILVATTSD